MPVNRKRIQKEQHIEASCLNDESRYKITDRVSNLVKSLNNRRE